MLRNLFNTITEISLATSVLIAVLLLLSPLLKKYFTAKCLLIACLILSARLLIPYNIRFPEPVLKIPVAFQAQSSNVPAAQNSTGANGSAQANPSPPNVIPENPSNNEASQPDNNAARLITGEDILAVVWASGAVVFIMIHAAGYVLLRKSLRRFGQPVSDEALLDLFERILEQMKLSSRRITLLSTPKIKSPMMTGFLKPVVLLPAGTRYGGVELEMILRHELVHYKRKDIWAKLLVTCANAIHWFNPLLYLMSAHMNKLIETACDSEIIRNTDMAQRRRYGESILNAVANDHGRQLGLSTYFHGGKKIMKQRLANIFDGSVKKRGTMVIAVVILAAIFSGTLVSCEANVKLDPDAAENPAVTDTAAVDSPVTDTAVMNPEPDLAAARKIAETWAEAVKNRDGKAQYELMSKELQDKVREEFEGLNWVTGTSSPWVDSYNTDAVEAAKAPDFATASVIFDYATSTGPAGSYQQDLTLIEENGVLKISAISDPVEVDVPTDASSDMMPTFDDLIKLLGLMKDELLAAVPETPEPVDEGGLGFAKTGIRVWFDMETYTKVAQVLIMTDKIDINGVKVGGSLADFKTVFGEPISDNNGDAHFKYGDIYLSVVRDTSDKVIAVYILAEDF